MNLEIIKILIAFAILAMSLHAVYIPIRYNRNDNKSICPPKIEALSSGILMGMGIVHMYSEAISESITHGINPVLPSMVVGATFIILLMLEHISSESKNKFTTVKVLIIMMLLHSISEGLAVGYAGDFSKLSTLAVAILSHKWFESLAVAILVIRALGSATGKIPLLFFAIATPLGVIIGNHLYTSYQVSPTLDIFIKAFIAGSFIYIGTLHSFKQIYNKESCCNTREFYYVALGFAIISIVTLI